MSGVLGLIVVSLLASAEGPSVVDMQGKSCTDYDCHAGLQSKKVVHAPVARSSCSPCHTQVKAGLHQFEPARPNEELCRQCHILLTRNYVHQPVADANCIGCHDPHQSDFQLMLRADPSKDLCLLCHANDPFMKKQGLHGPVATGACILCHEPHSSWIPDLLVAQGNRLCMNCHEERIQLDKQAHHVHPPLNGDCLNCHNPHASDYPHHTLDEPRKLCDSCHEEIEKLITESKYVHGAISKDQQCSNCHHGHSSVLPRLLKKSPLDTCLTCHDREIITDDGRKVQNMAALLKENPNHHGPIREADCSACHDPHAGSHFNRLRQAYPELFYAPFDLGAYQLCFSCHRSEMVTSEEGIGVTQFRNGSVNLHYVHVHRDDRGRTCRACHAVHASKSYAHIRESVPYGQWEYKLALEVSENGGRCSSGCHVPREYDRRENMPVLRPEDSSTSER